MPAPSKANYKTYEAQARMVRAIVAAHPDVKWNYKEILACYGSDMTEHALNHRFRKLRAHAVIVHEARGQGLDLKDMETDETALPVTQEGVDKKNIAKYFGQSTTDGIQFQFRGIKKDADLLRQTERQGGDVANCLAIGGGNGASVTSTPSKPTPSRQAGRRSGAGTKRQQKAIIKRTSSDEDEELDDDVQDWSGQDETPSKRVKTGPVRGRKAGTPSRRAAAKARDTIADASVQLQSSESPSEANTPRSMAPAPAPAHASQPRTTSIFGGIKREPAIQDSELDIYNGAFSTHGTDQFLSNDYAESSFYPGMGIDMDHDSPGHGLTGDGEI